MPEYSSSEIVPVCIKHFDAWQQSRVYQSEGYAQAAPNRLRCVGSECPHWRVESADDEDKVAADLADELVPSSRGRCALDKSKPHRYWPDRAPERNKYNTF